MSLSAQQPYRAAIYARVSTDDQRCDLQLTDLRKYVTRMEWQSVEYVEKESSVKRRPIFEGMIADALARKVDVILVWRIDRFARSMKDFVTLTLQLDAVKVRLISITESVDTGDQNPFAEFQRGLLALLAQLERKIIVARVKAGVAEAQRQGKHCGRPPLVFRRDKARDLHAKGMSFRAIARELKVSLGAVQRAVSKAA
jgi:putative DNA-invertase from lambdoid prophage Rac